MSDEPISADEFKQRLAQLCLTGNSAGLPRRQRDRQIILKSAALCFSRDRTYTEPDVNSVLARWISDVGHSLEIDRTFLRRALVDEQYLERSSNGDAYRLSVPDGAALFAPEVDGMDPEGVIQEAVAEARRKREQYQSGKAT